MTKIIGVSGNIASGKTTLSRALATKLEFEFSPESVEDNPYLSDFYNDMPAWAVQLQFHFLGHRASKQAHAAVSTRSWIIDRTIYEDGGVFVPVLVESGYVSERDALTYRRVFEMITSQLRPPDAIVFARASVKTLRKRIKDRGRPFEQHISKNYLDLLQTRYDKWVEEIAFCPVLKLNSDELDTEQSVEKIIDDLKAIWGDSRQGSTAYG